MKGGETLAQHHMLLMFHVVFTLGLVERNKTKRWDYNPGTKSFICDWKYSRLELLAAAGC